MNRERTRSALLVALVAAGSLIGAIAACAVTICDIQAYDEDGFSPLNGQYVTVRGVVTVPTGYFQPQYTSIYIQEGDCGVNLFCFTPLALALGDSVEVSGLVEEYVSSTSGAGATTELFCDTPSQIVVLSTGNPAPEPASLNLADVGVEVNEGRLVKTVGVVVENDFNITMYLGDPWSHATIQVYKNYNENTDFTQFVPGDTLEVTGVVLQYDRTPPFFEGYELVPRFQSDFQHAVPPPPPDPVYWPNATLDVPAATFRPDVGEILPISYAAPDRSETRIVVYDLQGRAVRTLTDAIYAGQSTLPEFYRDGFFGQGVRGWDGRDDLRRLVPAGTYICRLEATDSDGAVTIATAPAVVGVRLKR